MMTPMLRQISVLKCHFSRWFQVRLPNLVPARIRQVAILAGCTAILGAVQLKADNLLWNGGTSGTWNDATKWLYQSDGTDYLLSDFGISSMNTGDLTNIPVWFSSNPAGPTTTISLNAMAWTGGTSVGNAETWVMRNGSFAFTLNGQKIGRDGTNTNRWNFVFGDGVGTSSTTAFNGTAADPISMGSLTLGANGSANNQIGTSNSTVTFSNVKLLFPLPAASNLTIGSSGGGINNVFRTQTGDVFDGAAFQSAIINVGSTTGSSSNRIEVDGSNLTLSGALTINGYYNNSGPSTLKSDNEVLVKNGGKISGASTVTVGSGSALRILSGAQVTSSAGTVVNAFSNLLVEGAGSLYNSTGGGFTVGGTLEVLDGAHASHFGAMTVSNGGVFTLDGEGSQFTNTSTNANPFSGTKFQLGGRLEVLNGASFESQSALEVTSTDARIVVDSLSTAVFNTQTTNAPPSGLTVSGKLTIEGGGTLYVQGVFDINSSLPAGTTLVDASDGSTLKVDGIQVDGSSLLFTDIPVQGTFAIGQSGIKVAATSGRTGARLNVLQGTNLQIGDENGQGTYDLVASGFTGEGHLQIKAGGMLSGSGRITSADGGSNRFSRVSVQGGTVQVGIEGDTFGKSLEFQHLSTTETSSFHFDIFAGDSYDQIFLDSFNDNDVINQITLNLQMDPSLLDETSYFQLFGTLGGNGVPVGNFEFNFGDSVDALRALGLRWDTSEFASTGKLSIAQLAALLTFNNATALSNGGTLIISNDGIEAAQITSKTVEGAGWNVNGVQSGTSVALGNTNATATFTPGATPLNGTYTGKITLGFDNADQTSATWNMSHTISGRSANLGNATLAANNSYRGFGLTSASGKTTATLLGGTSSHATLLQMEFSAAPSAGGGTTFLSEVLTLTGTSGAAYSDTYVLSLTYDPTLLGSLEGGNPMLGWYTDLGLDDWAWVNAVAGNTGLSLSQFYLGAYNESYGLGAYGWDSATNSVWAVLNHNQTGYGDFAVIGAAAVPEPGRMMLLALGAAAALLRRRRSGARTPQVG